MKINENVNKNYWLVLIPLCLLLFYDFFQMNLMNSLSPVLIARLKISLLDLGKISSAFFYINLLLLYPAGRLLDSFPIKWIVSCSLVFTIIGIFVFTTVLNSTTLFIWRATSGVAAAFSYISCVKILSIYFPRRLLGLMLGLTGIIIMLAGVLAQYPLIFVIEKFGLETILNFDAIVGIFIIFSLLLIPKSFTSNNINLIISKKNYNVFLNLRNWLIALYASLNNLPLFVLGALWGNLYLQHTHSLSLKSASLISSLIFFGNMISAPLLGFLSDKIGERKKLMIASSSIMSFTCLILLLLPSKTDLIVLGSLFLLIGFSTGSQTLSYALVVDVNNNYNTAKATSLLSFLSVALGAVSQPFFAYVSEHNNLINFQYGMLLMMGAALISILSSIWIYKN